MSKKSLLLNENALSIYKWANAALWSLLAFLFAMLLLVMFSDYAAALFGELFGTGNDKTETLKFIKSLMGGVLVVVGMFTVNRWGREHYGSVEKGRIQDRFIAIIGHLGHEKEEIRTAAYYEFYQLARAHEYLRKDVFDTLCAHLRQVTTARKYNGKGEPEDSVQLLLDILFIPEDKSIFWGLRANLRGVNLTGASLQRAHMPNTNFSGACLIGADMSFAELHGCDFTKAKMHGVNLSSANMPMAVLFNTQLCGSILLNTNLQIAIMMETDFRGSCCGSAGQINSLATQMHRNGHILLPKMKCAYLGGVFNEKGEKGDFCDMIRRQTNKEADIESIVFYGGINKNDTDKSVHFFRRHVNVEDAEVYWNNVKIHIGNPPAPLASEDMVNKSINITPYTKEHADKWIAEYNEAMEKNNEKN